MSAEKHGAAQRRWNPAVPAVGETCGEMEGGASERDRSLESAARRTVATRVETAGESDFFIELGGRGEEWSETEPARSGPAGGSAVAAPARAPAFAVLWIADFALQAVLRLAGGGLETQAVALFQDRRAVEEELLADSSARVIACTASARAAGVEIGQTVPQAMARCAELVMRTARPAAEQEARASLLAAALTVSPQIEDTAPGVCTIEVTALAGERREAALTMAVEQLRQLGLVATAGLAPTPWLALLAARSGDDPSRATRSCPAVKVLQGRQETREFLRQLPLAIAEPPAEIAEILAEWGVRTLGELTALPKADVARRLGAAGTVVWERAAGDGVRPLRVWLPAQEFSAEMTLEEEIETLEPLLFVLRRFIDRLALELRTAGFVAGEMTLVLKLTDETVHERAFRLPEPTAREEILFRVLHTHLESLQTAATVGGFSLQCRPVRPLARQQGIFENALRDPHGFAETLARVVAVVGADRVGTPVLANTHRPDAVTLVTPASVVPAMSERPAVHSRRGLPLRRYRPPVAATVELGADGATPAFVWAEGGRGEVRRCAGPWCTSGDWWDRAQAWRREEWDVELEGGGLYRLLRVPEGWFVEGEYD